MKKFRETVLARATGEPIEGALVGIFLPDHVTKPTLYQTNSTSGSQASNPITTDEFGDATAYVPDGTYSLRIDITDEDPRWIDDVEIYDLDEIDEGTADALTAATEAASSAVEAAASAEAAGDALDDTQALYDTIVAGYAPPAPFMDIFIHYGQSLTNDRANQITASPVSSLYMFNGGFQFTTLTSPAPASPSSLPASAGNFTSLATFVPNSAKESCGPGLAYQSVQAGVDRQFFYAPGQGGMSLRLLRPGLHYFAGFSYAARRAAELATLAGYNPRFHVIFDHGHANTDETTDGGLGGETPTTTADCLTGLTKMRDAIHQAVSQALGVVWREDIILVPLLTGNSGSSVYTPAGVRQVQEAQRQAGALSGFRLAPSRSQLVANFEGDLVHPDGQAYRYYGEALALFIYNPLIVAPEIVSAAFVGTTITVTFNQAVTLSTLRPAETSLTDSHKGFELWNGSAYVALSGAVASGRTITLTAASGPSAGWKLRHGQQEVTTGTGSTHMPRTHVIAGSLGTAQDGTVLENCAISQEVTL